MTHNCEETVEVHPLLPHPMEEAVTNRGTGNVDVVAIKQKNRMHMFRRSPLMELREEEKKK